MNRAKWIRLVALAVTFPLLAWGCTAALRDAFIAGAYDFVSGTTTEVLNTLVTAAQTSGAA